MHEFLFLLVAFFSVLLGNDRVHELYGAQVCLKDILFKVLPLKVPDILARQRKQFQKKNHVSLRQIMSDHSSPESFVLVPKSTSRPKYRVRSCFLDESFSDFFNALKFARKSWIFRQVFSANTSCHQVVCGLWSLGMLVIIEKQLIRINTVVECTSNYCDDFNKKTPRSRYCMLYSSYKLQISNYSTIFSRI